MAHLEKKTDKKTDKESKKTKPPAHLDSDLTKVGYRTFSFKHDLKAIKRIWREVGWVTEGAPEKAMDIIFAADDTLVGCINGNPECSVLAQSGTMRLDETDLPLCVIAAITTSCIGRGQGVVQKRHCSYNPRYVRPRVLQQSGFWYWRLNQ